MANKFRNVVANAAKAPITLVGTDHDKVLDSLGLELNYPSGSDATRGKAVLARLVSPIVQEKGYNRKVISAATKEFLQKLEGQSTEDRLAKLTAPPPGVRGFLRDLCLKHFLLNSVQLSNTFAEVSLSSEEQTKVAHTIYICMELNDEAPKQHVLRYIENLCMAIISALGEINEISLISVVLDNKEVFPTKYRNMAIMNRMRDNNFPELEILKEHVLESLKIEKERRMDTIDLSDILDVFEKHPETYIEALAMVLKPQLQKQGGEESEKATEALDRLINFLKKRLDLSRKEKKMNILLAHLRKHPGMLLATEIAKLVSFGELYNLLVRVSREMILGETGGMQYAEDLVREGFTAHKKKQENKEEEEKEEEKEEESDGFGVSGLPSISEIRVAFDLKPFLFDSKGKQIQNLSTKSRSHSYIAEILLLPFIKGLYEAKAKYLNFTLETDKIFDEYINEVNEKASTTVSLDVKLTQRKRKETLLRLKDILATTLTELSRAPKEKKEELYGVVDGLLDSAEKLLLDRSRFEKAVEQDLISLKKNSSKSPAESRRLYLMASDAPPNGVRAPPSPWTEFFCQDIRAMKSIFKAGLAVASKDTIAWLVSTSVTRVVSHSLALSDKNKEKLRHSKDFQFVVKSVYLNLSPGLVESLKESVFDLLAGTYDYVHCKPDGPSIEKLCVKLLQMVRPFIAEFFRWLHEVNGTHLYSSLVGKAAPPKFPVTNAPCTFFGSSPSFTTSSSGSTPSSDSDRGSCEGGWKLW